MRPVCSAKPMELIKPARAGERTLWASHCQCALGSGVRIRLGTVEATVKGCSNELWWWRGQFRNVAIVALARPLARGQAQKEVASLYHDPPPTLPLPPSPPSPLPSGQQSRMLPSVAATRGKACRCTSADEPQSGGTQVLYIGCADHFGSTEFWCYVVAPALCSAAHASPVYRAAKWRLCVI